MRFEVELMSRSKEKTQLNYGFSMTSCKIVDVVVVRLGVCKKETT